MKTGQPPLFWCNTGDQRVVVTRLLTWDGCDATNTNTLHVQLIVYNPRSFLTLRSAAGLDCTSAASMLSPNAFMGGRLKSHFSEGASSSFFCRYEGGITAFASAAPSRSHSVRVCVGLFSQLRRRNPDCQDSNGRRDYNAAQAATLLHRALVNAPSVTVGALLWCLLPQGTPTARASSRQLRLAVTAHTCAVSALNPPRQRTLAQCTFCSWPTPCLYKFA